MANITEILYNGRIQIWQNGVMLGLLFRTEAIKMVDSGAYKIINSQAIEWVKKD